jgi:UDP-glucose 4-epimerase
MVIAVTGAKGFLGRHVSKALSDAGNSVVGLGRPEVEIPSPAFERRLADLRPDVVVHCAGPSSVPGSLEHPETDRAGSVGVTAALLATLERLEPTPKLVLLSSAAVYGQPRRLPITETDEPDPISPYGVHRLEVEQLALSSDIPAVIARVFSAYGEGLRRQVLWDIAVKVRAGGPVELWGTGDESRDFVHATDIGRAIVLLCARDRFANGVVNVASGRETTIREIAELLLRELGADAELRFRGVEREGDPLRWQADVERLRSLGWEPSVPVGDGVTRYARWAREQLA